MGGSRRRPKFLYGHVAAELRKRIGSGRYARGTAIPSLASLVDEFNVSPITIRRALRELTFEGALYGHQGLGVFVADTRRVVRVLSGELGLSLGDEIRRAGFTPGIAEVAFTRIAPNADLSRRLLMRRNMPLYRHEKLILADQLPIAIDIVHLPKELALRLRERLRNEFVFALMRQFEIAVGKVQFRFESASATDREASLLSVASRFPLIVARYVLFDRCMAPLFEGYTLSRADRMTFELTTVPTPGGTQPESKKQSVSPALARVEAVGSIATRIKSDGCRLPAQPNPGRQDSFRADQNSDRLNSRRGGRS